VSEDLGLTVPQFISRKKKVASVASCRNQNYMKFLSPRPNETLAQTMYNFKDNISVIDDTILPNIQLHHQPRELITLPLHTREIEVADRPSNFRAD
jgi:hypothetical protein